MRVIITGASGFIGSRVSELLRPSIHEVIEVVRAKPASNVPENFLVRSVDRKTDWSEVFKSGDVIIHTAAVAHGKAQQVGYENSVEAFHEINVAGTLNLAQQAAAKGAYRFIFISSIGVNGDTNSRPFTEADQPAPVDLYARSKWEAEQGLRYISESTGLEVVIIRPPLVYGPNAPGNFGSLIKWVRRGVPLPLGAIYNKRTLVALDNLVDLIITCIDHPAAANEVFLAGDGEELSTTELLQGVGKAMGKPARLIPVPASILMFAAGLFGKKAVARRVLGSLQVDISRARNLLGWAPPLSVEEGLRRCFSLENKF